jgi:cobyric acid synthase
MRNIITRVDEPVDLRADEIDWMPFETDGRILHTVVNDEDFIKNPEDKRNLRRMKRKEKQRKKWGD